MPCISRFYGISIYMYYRDHAPPHFHAIYGDAEATFLISSAELDDGSLPRRARRLVEDWALLHGEELSNNWKRGQIGEPFIDISPLE